MGCKSSKTGKEQERKLDDTVTSSYLTGKHGGVEHSPRDLTFLSDWLGRIGPVSRYKAAFYDYGFDSLDAVATITKRDLDKLNVKTGHRRIILKAVLEAKHEAEKNKKRDAENENRLKSEHAKQDKKAARSKDNGSKPVSKTDLRKISTFLQNLPGDMSNYQGDFVEHGWDTLEAMALIKQVDLEQIIVTKRGHREVVWHGLMDLRKRLTARSFPPLEQPQLRFGSQARVESNTIRQIEVPVAEENEDNFEGMDNEDFYRGMSQPRLSPRTRLSRLENFVSGLQSTPAVSKEMSNYVYVLSGRDRCPTHNKRHIGEGKYSRWDSFQQTAERYNPFLDSWSSVPIDPCFGAGMACSDESGTIRSLTGLSWSNSQGLLEMACPSLSHTWGGCVEGTDNCIYAISGFGARSGLTHSVERYDALRDMWEEKAMIPTSRHSFSIARDKVNDRIYVCGGAGGSGNNLMKDGNGGSYCPLTTIERYCPAENKWERMGHSLTSARVGLQSVWNHRTDSLFVLGGSDGAKKKSCCVVESYDEREGIWRQWKPMLYPRSFFGAVELPGGHGDIFAVGGKRGKEYQISCEIFDIRANKWRTAASMSRIRHSVPHPSYAKGSGRAGRRPRGYAVVLA